ncbi:MAG: OmpA family protein [Pseudomonadota bacterium]
MERRRLGFWAPCGAGALFSTALALLVFAGAAGAGPAGAVEIAAPAEAVLVARDARGLDRLAVPVAPVGQAGEGLQQVEGLVVLRAWRQADTRLSPVAMLAPMRAALVEAGFQVVFDCTDDGCGGVEYRFGVPLLASPAMRLDTGDMASITLRRDGAAGASWAVLTASRLLGAAHVQAATVEPEAAGGGEDGSGGAVLPTVGATAAIVDDAPQPTPAEGAVDREDLAAGAADLAALLDRQGYLDLRAIDFESGSTTMLPGAEAELDGVAALMAGRSALTIHLVGHSDTSGDFEANMALSLARAQRVREALAARGVAPGRMIAHAVGPLAPVTSNATPEGRARNRRVVLIPQQP